MPSGGQLHRKAGLGRPHRDPCFLLSSMAATASTRVPNLANPDHLDPGAGTRDWVEYVMEAIVTQDMNPLAILTVGDS